MFFGRETELRELNDLYETDSFQCVIIYGRRRVGKTTLITEFMRDKPGVFYEAQENTPQISLQDFSDKVIHTLGIEDFQSSFDNWEKAFLFLGKHAQEKRFIVAIDEFPYIARAEREIKSILQNAIDHSLKDTKLFLILCGSQVSFMEREVLGYNSPLYGRRTAQMRIEPFSFFESQSFYPNYNIQQQLEAYFILGGIPLYLDQFNDQLSIEENIKKNILKKYSYLYEEPKNLLKQELREPMNYNAIIEAIARGATNMGTIVSKSKINSDQCSRYLNILIELLIVEKELPLDEAPTSRKSIYKLKDFFFRFWYAYVFPNISELEASNIEDVFEEEIKGDLSNYYGHCFETVCHQHFRRENNKRNLPFRFSKLGKWWGNNPLKKRQEEIDLYAIGKEGIYLGECKWRNELVGESVFNTLVERRQLFHADKVIYVLYSKSGFTESLLRLASDRSDILLYTLNDFKL